MGREHLPLQKHAQISTLNHHQFQFEWFKNRERTLPSAASHHKFHHFETCHVIFQLVPMRFFALENPLRLVWSLWPLKNPSISHGIFNRAEEHGREITNQDRCWWGYLPPKTRETSPNMSRWWFQAIWKIWSSNWIISPNRARGEHQKKQWNHHPNVLKSASFCFFWDYFPGQFFQWPTSTSCRRVWDGKSTAQHLQTTKNQKSSPLLIAVLLIFILHLPTKSQLDRQVEVGDHRWKCLSDTYPPKNNGQTKKAYFTVICLIWIMDCNMVFWSDHNFVESLVSASETR